MRNLFICLLLCLPGILSAQLQWEMGHGFGSYDAFNRTKNPLPNVTVELEPTWTVHSFLSVRLAPFLLQTNLGLVAEQIATYSVEDCNCSMNIQYSDNWRLTQQVFWIPRPDTVRVQPLLGVGVAVSRMSLAFPFRVTQSFDYTADGPVDLSFATNGKARYVSWQAMSGIDVKVNNALGMRALMGVEQNLQQAVTNLSLGYESLNQTFFFDVQKPAWYWFGQLSLYMRFN